MSSDELVGRLRSYVGATSAPQVARYPITPAAIADWCDAIGDTNPCYLDPEFAADSVHGTLVAPPATLDIWHRPGLPTQWRAGPTGDPRGLVMGELDRAGYVGVVAVNSELEIARYPRPGDVVVGVQSLESVSDRKETGLGVGYFLTTRERFATADGEHLGELMFRILKFIPGTGRATSADSAAPDPSPGLRPRPAINRDNQVLFDGYRRHELRVPRCGGCGWTFFPPSPRCARCGSFEMTYAVADGRANLYSYTVVHHPQVPGFRYPLIVGVVELTDPALPDPVRLVGDIVGLPPDAVRIGMPLELEWLDSHPALEPGATDGRGPISLPQWLPAAPAPRQETLPPGALSEGEEIPPWVVPVTATRIVAGAIATRDFQDVHHDRELAVAKGSRDIFFNINTSVGHLQRYVTDFTGPQARIRALRVRLGAPAYPHSYLCFRGRVATHDPVTGATTVEVSARNELGDHLSGTVELELPR